MENNILIGLLIIILFVLVAGTNCFSRDLRLGVNYGWSGINGFWEDYWKMGYALGGDISYRVGNRVIIGIKSNFYGWRPAEGLAFIPSKPAWEQCGFGKVIEIMPTIRFVCYNYKRSSFFVQFGLGYHIVDFYAYFKAPRLEWPWYGNYDEFIDYSNSRVGILFGMGFSGKINESAEIHVVPSYQIIDTEIKNIEYYSVKFALSYLP